MLKVDTELLTWLIENNSGVHVVEAPNTEQTYFDACNQFVRDEWAKNPYQQPLLSGFEDVIRTPYHVPKRFERIFHSGRGEIVVEQIFYPSDAGNVGLCHESNRIHHERAI